MRSNDTERMIGPPDKSSELRTRCTNVTPKLDSPNKSTVRTNSSVNRAEKSDTKAGNRRKRDIRKIIISVYTESKGTRT